MTTDLDPPPDAAAAPVSTGLGRWVAAAIGLLAVGVALGVGDLVAAFTAPPSSPVLAVGNQFIRLTPEPLKEFATSTFGVHDKQVLLASMAVVIAVVAALGGLLSRRSAGPGIALVVVLGLVGATCAAASPTFTAAYLVAPLSGPRRRHGHVRRPAPPGPPRRRAARAGRHRGPRGRPASSRPRPGRRARRRRGDGLPGPHLRDRAGRRGVPRRRRAAAGRHGAPAAGGRLRHLGDTHLDHPERRLLPDRHRAAGPAESRRRTTACASTAWSTARSS